MSDWETPEFSKIPKRKTKPVVQFHMQMGPARAQRLQNLREYTWRNSHL